jgi:hypothetical protein
MWLLRWSAETPLAWCEVEATAADAHIVLHFTVVGVLCPVFMAYRITLGKPYICVCDCQLRHCL